MNTKAKLINAGERVLWTLIQAASATSIITVWEAIVGPVEKKDAWIIMLTVVLAALKNGLAQLLGSETGATLPESVAPVLPDNVAAAVKNGLLVAGHASPIQNGKPVEVWPVAKGDQLVLPF